jgi:hypothetical protein
MIGHAPGQSKFSICNFQFAICGPIQSAVQRRTPNGSPNPDQCDEIREASGVRRCAALLFSQNALRMHGPGIYTKGNQVNEDLSRTQRRPVSEWVKRIFLIRHSSQSRLHANSSCVILSLTLFASVQIALSWARSITRL